MTDADDTELTGSYSPAPCYHCGVMDDPRSQTCHECGEFICRYCDQRPGGLGLPFNHTPQDHLTPPESCDICGSLDIATRTEGYGTLCVVCTLDQLGLCRECGSLHAEDAQHCWVFPDDRRFPPGP
jgi:hypothetical protein